MALFSRRKKSVADEGEGASLAAADAQRAGDAEGADAGADEVAPVQNPGAPEVNISVQSFRGVGAPAGPSVALEEDGATASSAEASTTAQPTPSAQPTSAPAAPAQGTPITAQSRVLPLAPVDPPAQTETVAGMKDNVLLREALAQLGPEPTNEQLLGVLRQALQGHLFLRVQGDAREQLSAGKPLSIGVVRDGDRSFMLAFSSAGALQAAVQRDAEPAATSAVAQPVPSVLQQVISGGFTGLILDTASAPHRAVFPQEILQRALEQADPELALKALLAAPREADTEARVAEALQTARMWVAVSGSSEEGQVGIAEARTADGQRFLQLFSHPLEVVALGRGERPLPFTAEQVGKVLAGQEGISGVLIDPAGPTIAVRRSLLGAVIALAGS